MKNLSVTFQDRDRAFAAVRDVSFAVEPGRTLAIVGESGSGKSVSLLASTGLLPARAVVRGSALYRGTDLTALRPGQLRAIRGRHIGFVFQDPLSNLHPLKTVGSQIAEAITAHERVGRHPLRRRVLDLLGEVGIKDPGQRIDDYPNHFSGGMRQRVMIAMAIALNPGLIIADEPTTALDVTVQASILKLLRRLQAAHGTALIFVSHDLGVVSDIADDVVVMRDGEAVEAAPASEIYAAPRHEYTRTLLGAARHGPVPVPTGHGPAGHGPAGHGSAGGAAANGTGPSAGRAESPSADPAPLLAISAVHMSYRRRGRKDSFTALADVSFQVGEREIVGLVGESGSGKSTVGRIIAGLVRPTAGSVSLRGAVYNEVGDGPARLDAGLRSAVQVVFQDPYGSLNPRRRIAATLAEPFAVNTKLSAPQIRARVEALARRVELPPSVLERFPSQLSGGQRQRVAIARAVALEPAVVVADEPVSALDITTQAQIIALLRRLRAELGVSFLFISHDLGVVADLCERVVVLKDGQVVEQGPTHRVFTDPGHPYTRTLLASIPGRGRPAKAPEPHAPHDDDHPHDLGVGPGTDRVAHV
ncbi:peptide/nickel transport system ATP-binding protein [Streptosporangium becharense]|uniref:Peptide/nickel transport system ATP-binding protein n=1 Tax=Streptosporangium becharense TaxID=1816182 RepID=A0A7W9MKE4_9ACTN|nr:ABC transporter ATP-binding protein [Streptosporangium becharense]MBB2914564.1 peptide/nickel transport system ATP-binding protein [Streptosporangium becharense]MBB5823409.1 peptide/nickel transport system ATP-binding protein [Streptosporangium becharense]